MLSPCYEGRLEDSSCGDSGDGLGYNTLGVRGKGGKGVIQVEPVIGDERR